ncbi:Tyrosine--tRNA ligase [bioreactor metagenome]|uniref:Tyrosine--tRNA ligase n=1 Tax=bioreactor metagenome TaxID=1076179 RepID=A0A645GCN3_9ZZZZ
MPILEGLDGVNKMSKSLGNYIGINEPPTEIYGKAMSIPDELMIRYYELVTDMPIDELEDIKKGYLEGTLHPRNLKMRLAHTLVRLYHDRDSADAAQAEFVKVFQQRDLPTDIPEVTVSAVEEAVWLPKLLVQCGLATSNSEAKRAIQAGAVKINGEKFTDADAQITVNDNMIIQNGKRKFAKIVFPV